MEYRKYLNETESEDSAFGDQRYLKCWGCDYPYLENSRDQEGSLVPVPLGSIYVKMNKPIYE